MSGRRALSFALLVFVSEPSAQAAVEKPVAFDDALARIVARSTAVGIRVQRIDAAENDVLAAKGAFLPSLSIEASQKADRDVTASGPTISSRSLLGVARWNLFRFGADLAAHGATKQAAAAATDECGAETLNVEQDGVEALVAEIRLRQSLAVVTRIVDAQAETLRISRERYTRGFLPSQEVDKVAVDLDNARARLRGTEIQESAARARVVSLLGEGDVALEWPWKAKLTSVKPAALGEDLDLKSQPRWRASQARFESASDRVHQYRRQLLPSLDAAFSYGSTRVVDPSTTTTGWTGVLTLSVPLFTRFADLTAYRARTYEREIASYTLEQTERDSRREWSASRQAFATALETAVARDRTLAVSRRLYDDNLKRFRSGRASANDLAVDQNRLADSELLAIEGWADVHVAYARLRHALGQRVN